jgi:hypothetical protein
VRVSDAGGGRERVGERVSLSEGERDGRKKGGVSKSVSQSSE